MNRIKHRKYKIIYTNTNIKNTLEKYTGKILKNNLKK